MAKPPTTSFAKAKSKPKQPKQPIQSNHQEIAAGSKREDPQQLTASNKQKQSQNASRLRLLREIKSLGGDATDLDLLEDVLSGSEREDNDQPEDKGLTAKLQKTQTVDESQLLLELRSFMSSNINMDLLKTQFVVDDDKGGDDLDDDEDNDNQEQQKEPEVPKPSKKASKQSKQDSEAPPKFTLDLDALKDMSDDDNDEDVNQSEAANQSVATYGKKDTADVQQMVLDILKGKKPVDKLQTKLLIEPGLRWWEVAAHSIPAVPPKDTDREQIAIKYAHAKKLWEEEVAKYEKYRQSRGSNADKDFIATILKSGTTSDKVSALTLLIQESPLHAFPMMRDHLINGMARKKARREAQLAIDSIKDLLVNNVLPDRKLKYFVDQPVLSKIATPVHMIVWYFEDVLKKAYFDFIQLLEELAHDLLSHVKSKALGTIFELLSSKPEQEQNLLTLLMNKLGDLDRKIATKTVHLLSQLLLRHPAMKLIVIREAERLLFRPNMGERAQYYAVTFLNQIVLTHSPNDTQCANVLIETYFKLFEALVHKLESKTQLPTKSPAKGSKSVRKQGKKHGKKTGNKQTWSNTENASNSADGKALDHVDGIDAKMMAALLTGVNRAFPFAKLDTDLFDSHLNILFKISHIAPFNTCIQALTLILQVQSSREMVSDRFYRALYDTLLDHRLFEASKQSMFLNLIFKALRIDPSTQRVRSFIKRIVQLCAYAQVPLICGSLFLIGELARLRPSLWMFITHPEEDDEEEHFVDAPDEDNIGANTTAKQLVASEPKESTTAAHSVKYDGRKRDPLHTNADKACLWELCVFSTHFHPTVSLYAKTLLSGLPIKVPEGAKNYDPLQNHTLSRFLDRFVYKTPKKTSTLYHGSSLMQPRLIGSKTSDRLVAGGRRKPNVIFEGEDNEGEAIELDDAPVNAIKWADKSISTVAPDELFFYKYFKDHQSNASKEPKLKDSELDSDQDIGEEEAWDAMIKSSGFPADAMGDDDDDDDDDLMLDAGSGEDDVEDVDASADDVGPEAEVEADDDGDEDGEDADADADADEDMLAWAKADGKTRSKAGAVAIGKETDDDDVEDNPFDDEFDADFANELVGDEINEGDDGDGDGDDTAASDKAKSGKPSKGKRLRERLASKARDMGYQGDYFSGASGADEFASADDFAQLLDADNDDGDDDNGDEQETASRSKSKNRKNNSPSNLEHKKGNKKRKFKSRGASEGASERKRAK